MKVFSTKAPTTSAGPTRDDLVALYREAWELVEALRKVDWELAGEYGKRLNRSPLATVPAILRSLRRALRARGVEVE